MPKGPEQRLRPSSTLNIKKSAESIGGKIERGGKKISPEKLQKVANTPRLRRKVKEAAARHPKGREALKTAAEIKQKVEHPGNKKEGPQKKASPEGSERKERPLSPEEAKRAEIEKTELTLQTPEGKEVKKSEAQVLQEVARKHKLPEDLLINLRVKGAFGEGYNLSQSQSRENVSLYLRETEYVAKALAEASKKGPLDVAKAESIAKKASQAFITTTYTEAAKKVYFKRIEMAEKAGDKKTAEMLRKQQRAFLEGLKKAEGKMKNTSPAVTREAAQNLLSQVSTAPASALSRIGSGSFAPSFSPKGGTLAMPQEISSAPLAPEGLRALENAQELSKEELDLLASRCTKERKYLLAMMPQVQRMMLALIKAFPADKDLRFMSLTRPMDYNTRVYKGRVTNSDHQYGAAFDAVPPRRKYLAFIKKNYGRNVWADIHAGHLHVSFRPGGKKLSQYRYKNDEDMTPEKREKLIAYANELMEQSKERA